MVKSDMVGNADKMWKHLADTAKQGKTIEELMDAEIKDGGDKAKSKEGTVCLAMLWLKRALKLVEGILKEMLANPTKKLTECVQTAYDGSLKKAHNFVMRGTFSVGVKAAPNRETFMKKLFPASSDPEAELKKLGEKDVPKLTLILTTIETYQTKNGIEKYP